MYVGIVGLGYVGLTLAVALAKKGVRVIGLDVDHSKLEKIQAGLSPFYEQDLEPSLREVLADQLLEVTNDKNRLREITHCVITVGTPLEGNSFDTTQIEKVINLLGGIVSSETVFCLRSTVGLGTTRKLMEILKSIGHSGQIAMCPERTIEGFALKELNMLPQIIGAESEIAAKNAHELFKIFDVKIIFSENFEVAELAKLACNAWRDLYFAFSNEVALIGEELRIDARQALSIAQDDYPRFKVAKPGPVGGPCLVKDGVSLASSSPERFSRGSLFDLSRRVNECVVDWAVRKIEELSTTIDQKPLRIGVVGLAFKGNPPTNDLRNSPSIDFLKAISRANSTWVYFGWDPQKIESEQLQQSGITKFALAASVNEVFENSDVITIWHLLNESDRAKVEDQIKSSSDKVILDLWSNFSKDEVAGSRYFSFGSGS